MHFKVAHAYEINLEDIKPEHMSMEYSGNSQEQNNLQVIFLDSTD